MSYKILRSIWFNFIGIVAIDSDGHGWKCYIGTGTGYDEDADCQLIAGVGMPTGKAIAVASFPSLDADKFIS
jgi:hypothetical protein